MRGEHYAFTGEWASGHRSVQPTERDLAASYRDAMGRFATDSGGEFRSFPGITCFRSPLPFLLFNMAFVEDVAALDGRVLRAVQAFYREKGVEWCLTIPPRFAGALEKVGRHVAVSSRRTVPEMILPLGPVPPWPSPAELRVRRVRDIDELQTWVRVASLAFDVGSRHFFDALASPAALDGSGMTHYLGCVDGHPVATASLYVLRGIAGVHAVGTLPRARGKGYGAAMCADAVREGISQGCYVSALQATPSGYPVYFRMGFRELFDFEEWVVRAKPRAVRASEPQGAAIPTS